MDDVFATRFYVDGFQFSIYINQFDSGDDVYINMVNILL